MFARDREIQREKVRETPVALHHCAQSFLPKGRDQELELRSSSLVMTSFAPSFYLKEIRVWTVPPWLWAGIASPSEHKYSLTGARKWRLFLEHMVLKGDHSFLWKVSSYWCFFYWQKISSADIIRSFGWPRNSESWKVRVTCLKWRSGLLWVQGIIFQNICSSLCVPGSQSTYCHQSHRWLMLFLSLVTRD